MKPPRTTQASPARLSPRTQARWQARTQARRPLLTAFPLSPGRLGEACRRRVGPLPPGPACLCWIPQAPLQASVSLPVSWGDNSCWCAGCVDACLPGLMARPLGPSLPLSPLQPAACTLLRCCMLAGMPAAPFLPRDSSRRPHPESLTNRRPWVPPAALHSRGHKVCGSPGAHVPGGSRVPGCLGRGPSPDSPGLSDRDVAPGGDGGGAG